MFQSTPPHGGRQTHPDSQAKIDRFNPRPRTGGDQKVAAQEAARLVSIHAPARGATPAYAGIRTGGSFNPRPRTGGDKKLFALTPEPPFQSTPPHGGRHNDCAAATKTTGFNPRPRTGGDRVSAQRHKKWHCFNPRPRTGGDFDYLAAMVKSLVSIHAPARGATFFKGTV